MTTLQNYLRNLNADVAIIPAGSSGVPTGGIAVGMQSSTYPELFNTEDVREALSDNTSHVRVFEDFNGTFANIAAVEATGWAIDAGSTGTVASGTGGTIVLTTAATEDDHVALALSLSWAANQSLRFKSRLKASTETAITIQAGLGDALTFTGGDGVSVATDGAFFQVVDGTATFETIQDGTPLSTASAVPLDSTGFFEIEIFLDPENTVHYYVDGVEIASITDALVDESVLLTPYIAVIAGADAAKAVTVDYIYVDALR